MAAGRLLRTDPSKNVVCKLQFLKKMLFVRNILLSLHSKIDS